MTPERLAEIDVSISMFRQLHPGSFGEIVAELRTEVDRLRTVHGHDFTNVHEEPVTCICGVRLMDWLEARKAGDPR